jgi:predicted metal-dependent phosphoesterase TrpH
VPLYSVSRVVPNANEKRRAYWANTPDIEKFARKEYKKYPYNISHYDPESDQYIASERDDYKKRIEVDSYNHIID